MHKGGNPIVKILYNVAPVSGKSQFQHTVRAAWSPGKNLRLDKGSACPIMLDSNGPIVISRQFPSWMAPSMRL